MRKKLFAILMSAMMMVTFMPAMAFADVADLSFGDYENGHDYLFDVGNDGYVDFEASEDWSDIVSAANKATNPEEAKYVTIVSAPTHDADGVIELKCTESTYCDKVITAKVAALKCTDAPLTKMSYATYLKALVAQNSINQAKADKLLATNDYCFVKAHQCKECGLVVETTLSEVTAAQDAAGYVKHEKPSGMYGCKSSFVCTNDGCGKTIKIAVADKTADHSPKANTSVEKAKPNCGKGTKYEAVCDHCKETYTYYDTDVDETMVCEAKGVVSVTTKTIDGVKYALVNNTKIGHFDSTREVWVADANNGYIVDNNFDTPRWYKYDTVISGSACDSEMVVAFTCKVCGAEVAARQTLEGNVHNWEEKTVAATCVTRSYKYKVCADCGKYYDATNKTAVDTLTPDCKVNATTEDDTLGHSYTVTKVDSTCMADGYYLLECSKCKATVANHSVTVGAKEFTTKDQSKWVAPNGTVDGARAVGEIELKYMAPKTEAKHVYTKKIVIKAETCANDRVEGYECDLCHKICMHTEAGNGYAPTVVTGTKLSHTMVEGTKAATCEDSGFSYMYCKVCNPSAIDPTTEGAEVPADSYAVVPGSQIPRLGGTCDAKDIAVTKAATYTKPGIVSAVCSKCGAVKYAIGTVDKLVLKKAAKPTVKAGKKQAKITVKKVEGATGYQIAYKKAGKSYKTVQTTSLKKTIKKLAKGKKYTFKVRAYVVEDGQTVYGDYSAAKTVKIK